MRDGRLLATLIGRFGRKYSDILGIRLEGGDRHEIFKWFLASILFGAPITEKTVIKTYRCFEERGLLTPERILEAGWDGIVEVLDEGGYTRYDFKTATKLLTVMRSLLSEYGGDLNALHERASDHEDLERRLRKLGKGIGKVTVSIFLRELRGIWEKADPEPTPLVVLAARKLGISRRKTPKGVLEDLKRFWRMHSAEARGSFINFETALLRLGKDYCRKGRCAGCGLQAFCEGAR